MRREANDPNNPERQRILSEHYKTIKDVKKLIDNEEPLIPHSLLEGQLVYNRRLKAYTRIEHANAALMMTIKHIHMTNV